MDKQTAIDLLDNLLGMIEDNHDSDYDAALHMGIDALKMQLSKEDATKDATFDYIDRQAAVKAMWKALYDYEDKTEKQFQESDELDVADWIVHRGFVQNMSDIDRQTILNLPSVQPQRWIPIKWHDCTDEEREEYGFAEEIVGVFDCDMPYDNQEILVTTSRGYVEKDVCYIDDGFSLDSGYDWIEDITAWMPLPPSYKEDEDARN